MRLIGFSTGALACGDFRRGLGMLRNQGIKAVELSALRYHELVPLLDSVDTLELSQFSYISVHAPSNFGVDEEEIVVSKLLRLIPKKWPIIIHPDTICHYSSWLVFGELLLVENLDRRKRIGRTAKELSQVFERLPSARLCCDLGHARQFDSTMTEAFLILREFGTRLGQLHVSEVNTSDKHDPLSLGTILAFREVAHMIPSHIPVILESRVSKDELATEVKHSWEALSPPRVQVAV